MTWPAFAYLYGTWGYALERANEMSAERGLRMHLYRAEFCGMTRWAVSWDPKP